MTSRQSAGSREMRRLLGAGTAAATPDHELIERFVARTDEVAEAAFAALVARHGPMVLKVCRAVLRNREDAQDAFQATFLVLACKAARMSDRELLANWLYGVALRTALKARSRASRRQHHERRAAVAWPQSVERNDESSALHRALHEEIRALPEKYRAAVVLCYLKGVSREAAADELQCAVSTVGVRLMRARERLKARLARRRLIVPAGLLGFGSAAKPLTAAVPTALAEQTVRAATRLAVSGTETVGVTSASTIGLMKEVRRSMMLNTLKTMAGCVLASCVLFAGVVAVSRAGGGDQDRNIARDEQQVLELEHAWADALVRCDASALDRIVAYEMVGTDPGGRVWDKSSYLETVKRGDFQIRTIELTDLKVRVFGDAAVATGLTVVNRTAPSGFGRGAARYTDMYVRRGGCWQCVAWQSLGIADAELHRPETRQAPLSAAEPGPQTPSPGAGEPKELPSAVPSPIRP